MIVCIENAKEFLQTTIRISQFSKATRYKVLYKKFNVFFIYEQQTDRKWNFEHFYRAPNIE